MLKLLMLHTGYGDGFKFTRGEGGGYEHGDAFLEKGYGEYCFGKGNGEYCFDGDGFSDIGAAESLAELLNAGPHDL